MKSIRILLFLGLFTAACNMARANTGLIVEHYTVEQGLPNNFVYCSLTDRDGFLWFGTWYGLCSFDGAKFRAYNRNEEDFPTLSPRKIQMMLEDKNGFLWMKTVDRKLYLFNKETERFRVVYDEMKQYSENIQIIKIQLTDEGDVLLLTKNKSLLLASTDASGHIEVSLLYDSNINDNGFYDYRLPNNVLRETARSLNWVGKDYRIASLPKTGALRGKPANFITQTLTSDAPHIFTAVATGKQCLWTADESGNIYRIDAADGRVEKMRLPGIVRPIDNLLLTDSGVLYLCISGSGIYEYNLNSRSLSRIPVENVGVITQSFTDKYDKIWFLEKERYIALCYDPVSSGVQQFAFPKGAAITDFTTEDAGQEGLFLLLSSGELFRYNRQTKAMESLSTAAQFAADGTKNLFFGMQLDRNNVLWLSSSTQGAYRVNFPHRQFRLVTLPGVSEGIKTLFQAADGDIWIGTRQQEVYRLDSQGVLKQKFDAGNYRIGNVYHIMEDHQGNLWFSTKGDGLVRGEPDENSPLGYRFVRFTNHPKQSGSISGNDVYCTFQDSRGRIWAGVLAGGLNLVSSDGAGQTVFRHKYNGMKRYPPYGLYMDVRNICEDKSGRIWVGTMDGLMSFNVAFESPEQIQFETYRTQPLNADVAENDIYVLFCDKRDSLWVSVFGSGVNKLTAYDAASNTPTFKRYGLDEGLNSDVVISVAEDRNKNLWLVSEAGLSSLNPATGRIHNYEKYDSFYDMKMEEGALLYTLGGELWIGCREGILVLNPEKMKNEAVSYPTYIVDFRVSNRDLRTFREHPILNKSIRYADSLTLKHNQSMFTIEYAALNYFNQHNVTYRYLLEGYEKQWHLNGRNRIASYTNVPPGSYLFRVQSLDEGDPRMHSERTLQITVLPPWWLTWWAYSFYVLLGVALLYVILRTIFFMVKMKNDVYIGQRLAELKIKFFTNISHELRTPLTLIKAPLQELKERESLSQKGKQYVEMMEKSANQMLQLVNQILDFRKIQNGKMRLHVARIELNTLLKRLHEEFRVMAEEKSISFIFQPAEEPIFLWADRDKLEVVIRNLLSNAFKYTPQEGTIFISGGLLENNNRRCYIRVEDSGVGIPSAKLSEIFERFSQGDNSRNAAYQGTGIGLALSKELIALHHGTIHAESENRQGSVFIVELNLGKEHYKASEVDFYVSDSEAAEGKPAVATTATGATESQPDETDASLPTLLIVEDNRDLGRLLKMQLEGRYNILLAANGVDGLKAVQLHHPDIVVTDQMMPEMSGLELLEHIRGDFQISHIPVIILTARHDENEKTRAISMGANAYITKPFSKEYLVARIEQLLGERRRFRERVLQRTETPQPDSYEQFLVKKDLQLLDKIRQSIEANMDNSDFSIDTIAAGLGLSRSAFFKKVKSLTGLAPIDLIKEIRLNKALELIKTTNMSITDISFAVGFREAGYFGKCFRKKYNRTPKEVMNELRTFASRNP